MSGTTKSLKRAMAVHGEYLGRLLTPSNRNSVASCVEFGLPFAVDNGAFSGFNPERFRWLLARLGGAPNLLWVVCPDVVADARKTLDLFDQWEPELRAAGVPVAFVGQDGQEDLPVPWDRFDCLFLGGAVRCFRCGYGLPLGEKRKKCPVCWGALLEWKLSHAAAELSREAKARGKMLHMGRVNSRRRMRQAHAIGCDTVDGSSASRWGDKYLWQFPHWIKQIEEQQLAY